MGLYQTYNQNQMMQGLSGLAAQQQAQAEAIDRYNKNMQIQRELRAKSLTGTAGAALARETALPTWNAISNANDYGLVNAWNINRQANYGTGIIGNGSESAIHANPDAIPYEPTPAQESTLAPTSASNGTLPTAGEAPSYIQSSESAIAPTSTPTSASTTPSAIPTAATSSTAGAATTTALPNTAASTLGDIGVYNPLNAVSGAAESGAVGGATGAIAGAEGAAGAGAAGAETAASATEAAGGLGGAASTALPILGMGAGIAGMAMSGKVTAGGMATTIGSALMLVNPILGGIVALGGAIANFFD